jgi:transposase
MTDNLEVTIGVDVSKDKLDVMILPGKIHHVIDNNKSAIKKLITHLDKNYTILMLALESTGGYEKELRNQLMLMNIPVHVAHPNRVYHYAKSKGIFGKTDKADATILARYAAEVDTKATAPISAAQEEIAALSSRRGQLMDALVAEKNRHCVPIHASVKKSVSRMIKQTEREIALIDEALGKLIDADEALKAKRQLLETVKGIGRTTSVLLVAELPELGTLTKRQIGALAGLAPRNCESGKRQGKRKIAGGRPSVRKALYLCSLSGSRWNKRFKAFYDKLCAAGKLPKVALIAVARKMLIMLNAMVQNNSPWKEEFTRS